MEESEYCAAAEGLRSKLLKTARMYLQDEADAEDMVQETLTRLWQMRDSLHPPVEALSQTIVRNLSLDFLRRTKPMTSIEKTDIAYEETDTFTERYNRVMSIIDTLPTLQQTVIRLRLNEGKEYSEISRLTGMKETALRKVISRARLQILSIYNNMNK